MSTVFIDSHEVISYALCHSNHSIDSLSSILDISKNKLLGQEGLSSKEIKRLMVFKKILNK